jgi:hypothetical protein
MNVPTKHELIGNNEDDLDARCVVKHFLGKTVDDAYEMFRSGSCFCEDLMWMEPAGLEYYLRAATKYLQSEDSRGDWEFALFTLGALMIQVTQNQLPLSLVASIRDLVAYVKSNLAKFGVNAEEPNDSLFFEHIEKIENAIG